MKKHIKQVYTIGDTTYLSERDYKRELRKRERELHNWKISSGLFSKGKLLRPRKRNRRIQLDRADGWVARLEERKLTEWNCDRHYWAWERI